MLKMRLIIPAWIYTYWSWPYVEWRGGRANNLLIVWSLKKIDCYVNKKSKLIKQWNGNIYRCQQDSNFNVCRLYNFHNEFGKLAILSHEDRSKWWRLTRYCMSFGNILRGRQNHKTNVYKLYNLHIQLGLGKLPILVSIQIAQMDEFPNQLRSYP